MDFRKPDMQVSGEIPPPQPHVVSGITISFPMQRKSAILLAANQHFAHYGFRGASLRDIARDAGVSLTLLNHHFGSKFQLLSAVIDSHREMLDERASALLAVMRSGP